MGDVIELRRRRDGLTLEERQRALAGLRMVRAELKKRGGGSTPAGVSTDATRWRHDEDGPIREGVS